MVCADVGPFARTDGAYAVYDGTRLPFGDASFDTTLLLLTLHHCEKPEAVLDEALRVTRTRLIVTESVYRNRLDRFWLDLLDGRFNRLRHGGRMPTPLGFRRVEDWQALFASRACGCRTVWLGGFVERLIPTPWRSCSTREPAVDGCGGDLREGPEAGRAMVKTRLCPRSPLARRPRSPVASCATIARLARSTARRRSSRTRRHPSAIWFERWRPTFADAPAPDGNGVLEGDGVFAVVDDTFAPLTGFNLHKVRIERGELNIDDTVLRPRRRERRRRIRPTTQALTCCTPRCARCWARTSNKPARGGP